MLIWQHWKRRRPGLLPLAQRVLPRQVVWPFRSQNTCKLVQVQQQAQQPVRQPERLAPRQHVRRQRPARRVAREIQEARSADRQVRLLQVRPRVRAQQGPLVRRALRVRPIVGHLAPGPVRVEHPNGQGQAAAIPPVPVEPRGRPRPLIGPALGNRTTRSS